MRLDPEDDVAEDFDFDVSSEDALTAQTAEMVDVPWQEGARLIDDCTYLFAVHVRELEELTLGLTIVEAKAQEPITTTEDTGPLAFLKLGSSPIEQDDTCRVFEIVFDRNHMISYTVLNESYGRHPEPPEIFTGKLFRTFSRSHLLEFTERTTYASRGHPAPLMHFENRLFKPRRRRDYNRSSENSCRKEYRPRSPRELIAGECTLPCRRRAGFRQRLERMPLPSR